ncbi:MAG: glycosyltransferase family 9 protein, partial [Candidatus Binataceae bacterium]
LRYDKIGDMILSTSLINAIAKSHSTITLDVLASPANAPVLRENPHVSSVIIWDKARPMTYARLWRDLRRRRYDAVVDCMVLAPSTTTLLLMLASGARYRIGVGGRINDFALTVRVPGSSSAAHHIEHSAVLVTAFGVNPETVAWRPTLFFSAAELARAEREWNAHDTSPSADRPPRMLVNISAGLPMRRWPEERFVEVIGHIKEKGPDLSVLLISGPADLERAARIAQRGGVPYAPTPGLRDALALVATADVVFTPNTSIAHAASACAKPAVILFERGKEMLWGGYRIPGSNVASPDETLATLAIEPVMKAVDELIGPGRV